MATEQNEALNTDRILEAAEVPEAVPITFDTLLEAAKRAQDVAVTEIDPCQSVTVEANGKPVQAFLVVKSDKEV